MQGLLQLIEAERRSDTVNRLLLQHLLRMLTALGIYEDAFQVRESGHTVPQDHIRTDLCARGQPRPAPAPGVAPPHTHRPLQPVDLRSARSVEHRSQTAASSGSSRARSCLVSPQLARMVG